MAERSIFRQTALDRLSSPEQLDRLMTVTDPRGWIALIGVCVLLFVLFLWSIFGSVPTTIMGQGILLTTGGVLPVEALGSGVVAELMVREGQSVEAGQVIARIYQPELEQQIERVRERLRTLREERTRQAEFTSTNTALELEALDREREDLGGQIAATMQRIAWLEQRLEAERQARELGLVTSETVQNTSQFLDGTRAELSGLELRLQDNEQRRLIVQNQARRDITEMDLQIREQEETLAALELQFRTAAQVVSPYAGVVQELRTVEGQLITTGMSVASVEQLDSPLRAVVFVSTEGKRIQEGMDAQIAPVTVKREEYGYILGKVTFVSGQPATPQGMQRILGNEIMVEQLSSAGAPFLVEVNLERDTATVSRLRWSSPGGPPLTVESGTQAEARVIVARQRPISLVIPIFRNALGLAA